MASVKLQRGAIRTVFTKVAKDLDEELAKDPCDATAVNLIFKKLQLRREKLIELDGKVEDELLRDPDTTEIQFTNEAEEVLKYSDRYCELETSVFAVTKPKEDSDHSSYKSANNPEAKKNVRLPKLDWKKFGGDPKEWLGFWSQFQVVHEDENMASQEKYQYLIQATMENSKARAVVESFPPTAANYPKVIDYLQQRFGKKDLLVEIYTRELIKLVMGKSKDRSIATLYDQLETQLRALDSLGIKSESTIAILYPLVESALPEEILRLWQRKRSSVEDEDADRLNSLMSFLRVEVESEIRVKLAKTGFTGATCSRSQQQGQREEQIDTKPTAIDLYSGQQRRQCVFCNRENHSSTECYRAPQMSFEDRLKAARSKGVCLSCLQKGHVSKACKHRLKCLMCGRNHHVIMCSDLPKKSPEESNGAATASSTQQGAEAKSYSNYSSTRVQLQTLQVIIKAGGIVRNMRAIIDSGSDRTYLSLPAIEELKLKKVGTEKFSHALFGGVTTPEEPHDVYNVLVGNLKSGFTVKLKVFSKEKICGRVQHVPPGRHLEELKEMGIHLTDTGPDDRDIHLLIGSDVAGTLKTGRIYQTECGLTAEEFKLGWTLQGPIQGVKESRGLAGIATSLHIRSIDIQDMWKLDVIGITDPVETQTKAELTESAQKHFEETVRVNEEGRYEVSLPWIEGHPQVSTNKESARRRLRSAYRKLEEKKAVEDYQKIFNEWQEMGVIERVEKMVTEEKVSYLPHHPVFKPTSATTPIRPVFDASAKVAGQPSLNDCLEKGPNLIELLPDLLLRFRWKRYGIISDIKKAFLMISVREEDRDFLRFLWWENGEEVEFRHCRVVFGVTSSPFLLAATLNHHLNRCKEEDKVIAEQLKRSLYVDNCVTSFDYVEELQKFKETSVRLLASAKMDLRGWEWSRKDELAETEVKNELIPVLGMLWNVRNDSLSLDLRSLKIGFDENDHAGENSKVSSLIGRECGLGFGSNKGHLTKRGILSAAHKIFDPMGVCSAVLLVPKIILQDLWKKNIGWDDPVPKETEKIFFSWSKDLRRLSEIEIPRWTVASVSGHRTLHVFSDASRSAYAACAFVRQETLTGVSVQLIIAKTRVAPTKRMTIPRLELLGCSIGARLAETVKTVLEEPEMETTYWTDSSNALYWIKETDNWNTYVHNRVREIRKLCSVENWRHVPGKLNPADLPSRGCTASQLLQLRWWEGPSWLRLPEEEWPKSEVNCDLEEVFKERKKTVVSHYVQKQELPWYLKYFSTYRKIVRVLAWMMRWRNGLGRKPAGSLTVDEEEAAEKKLWKLVQEETYKTGDQVLSQLNVKKCQDGLWRVQTKIIVREDSEGFRFPVLLPYSHPLTRMIVAAEHKKRNHCGVQVLQNVLREKLWIPKSRRVIREVVNACGTCRRHIAKNGQANEGPLPVDRVRNTAIFEVIGIDLGGPLYLKSKQKVWFVIFTCAVYRAVHLELVSTLSTEGFLQSLRRFVARRGRPTTIYTDNGTNFEGASNALKALDWNQIVTETGVERMKWVFIPPSAPWWGGFWERMVGLTKGLLRRILGKASLEMEELSTVLCDVEQIINSRPLTYLSESPEDLICLSPSLFLIEAKGAGVADLDKIDSVALNRRVQYRQKLRDALRKRFRSEYLGMLVHRCDKKKLLKIGVDDIVLIGDDNKKRVDWKLGRVLELFPGRDGVERVAKVKTATGEILRPVQRLYPLEMSNEKSIVDSTTGVESLPEQVKRTKSGRVVKIPSRFMIE